MISENSTVLLDRYIVLYGLIGKQRKAFNRASEDCWHLLQKIKTKSMAGVITTTEFGDVEAALKDTTVAPISEARSRTGPSGVENTVE